MPSRSFEGCRYIRGLEQCNRSMILEVGGKNASLGELLRAGFNVPFGFAITADAYTRFFHEFDLWDRMKEKLSSTYSDNLEEVAAEIRKLMESYPIPKDIKEEIMAAYDALVSYSRELGETNSMVAVRSSASAEDLPTASFAGQFDSFLAIKNRGSLLEAVKKCWSSLFTARGISYRNFRDISHKNSSMSVGVQKMVDAKASGVIFTLDPVTGNRANIVINANWGLGESIVQGITNVDAFIINKVTLDIIKKEISKKENQSVVEHKSGKVIKIEIPQERKNVPCLTDEEIKELVRQAKLIEQHYGKPQDIEFAIDKGLEYPRNIFIIQSRPETKWSTQIRLIMEPKGHIADHLADWFRGERRC